jgi:hypothetical protein
MFKLRSSFSTQYSFSLSHLNPWLHVCLQPLWMAGTTHRNHGRKIERQQQLELRGLAVFCGTRSASAPSPGRVQQGAAWCCLMLPGAAWLLLLSARPRQGECSRLLPACCKVLPACCKVLPACCKVLPACSKVLPACCLVLSLPRVILFKHGELFLNPNCSSFKLCGDDSMILT